MKKKQEVKNTMFWENQNKKKLIVLNPDDFERPVPNLLDYAARTLNEVAAISDSAELVARNELVKFFFDQPELRAKIKTWLEEKRTSIDLPTKENDFLYYYESATHPYWELTKNFIQEITSVGHVPNKLQPFIRKTTADVALEHTEKRMAADISQKLRQVARMEGIVWMTIKNGQVEYSSNDDKNIIIGQKAFSSVWSSDYQAPVPDWCDNKFWHWIGVKKIMQKRANYLASKKAKQSAIIEHFPSSIFEDIAQGVYQKFHLNVLKQLPGAEKSPEEIKRNEAIKKFWNKMPTKIRCQFYFSYDDAGLSISLITVKKDLGNTTAFRNDWRVDERYDGFTKEEREIFLSKLEKIDDEIAETKSAYQAMPIIKLLDKLLGIKIGDLMTVPSPLTNQNFQWHYIANLYNSKEHQKTYRSLLEQRRYFWKGMEELDGISNIIKVFETKASENNIPLCMPVITNSKIGVTFNKLAPINMLAQKKPMVAFSFPAINGHIICLTGKHGRGKSVAGKSVLENLWLAHTGLPVFAESFSTDIKEMIGAVTNDQGEGSTATVFAQKTKNLFANISKIPAHKSLLFIDEIGKGTQEESGLVLGQQILHALNRNGNSVIFNTQIMRLAEYAKENLQAICLKVNNEHQFVDGIGTGQMEELIKEVGLDKYLKN